MDVAFTSVSEYVREGWQAIRVGKGSCAAECCKLCHLPEDAIDLSPV